jgi:hypothetical protein
MMLPLCNCHQKHLSSKLLKPNNIEIMSQGKVNKMSESINQINLVLELVVTFSGVFLAFMLDRGIDRYKEWRSKKDLLRSLSFELKGLEEKLTGNAYKLYTDIWDSAVASGQLQLLGSEQLQKLTRVYSKIKGTDYEAERVRDAKEDFMKENEPLAAIQLETNWINLSTSQKKREGKTKGTIDELLKESWLN